MKEGLTYYPANLPALILNMQRKKIPNHEEIMLDWWSETSFFKYPKLLVSAYYGMEYDDFRKTIKFPDNGILIGDSGGYQLFSFKIQGEDKTGEINPVTVLKWQEKNCDIGIILDFPIFKNDRKTFDDCLRITSENAAIAIANRKRSVEDGFLLYNVLQSVDYNRVYLDLWYNEISKHKLDGWCISCKPGGTPMFIALDAMYLYSKGHKKNFHILGSSGSRTIPVMAWLSRYIENFTFDSSSYFEGGKRRSYFHPLLPLKKSIQFGRVTDNQFKRLPCFCPVCRTFKTVEMFKKDGTLPGGLMSLHNLYHLVNYTKILDILKEDKEVFNQYCKIVLDREVHDAIAFIEYCIEYGFDAAFVKFQTRFRMYENTATTGKLADY